jgi:hypothetical protein
MTYSLRKSADSLLWASAYAMYEGKDLMGVSPGDLADALQSLADLLEVDGPYARLSRIAKEARERDVIINRCRDLAEQKRRHER